jgi:hypothetical protein
MAYECCVNAHIQTNTPLDLISSNCVTTSTTKSERPSNCVTESVQGPNNDGLIIGLVVGLGICSLLLLVSILVGFKVSKAMSCTNCLKHDSQTAQGNTKRYTFISPFINISHCSSSHAVLFSLSYMYRVTEEYDLVANPIYNISMQHTPQQGTITTSGSTVASHGNNYQRRCSCCDL